MAQLCQTTAAMASSRWVTWVIRASEDLLARHGVSQNRVYVLFGITLTGPGQICATKVAVEPTCGRRDQPDPAAGGDHHRMSDWTWEYVPDAQCRRRTHPGPD